MGGQFMFLIESLLFILGLVLLVVGYRKNDRNVLLAAAVVLLLVGGLSDFVSGFHQGFMMGRS
jgi:hypothetical protein